MSHRKYGLDHLGCRTARRLVSPALALWLCSQPFAARADLYFNPRFLADDPAAVADLSGFEKGGRFRQAPIASIFISTMVL